VSAYYQNLGKRRIHWIADRDILAEYKHEAVDRRCSAREIRDVSNRLLV
jgi:hypothetical protein